MTGQLALDPVAWRIAVGSHRAARLQWTGADLNGAAVFLWGDDATPVGIDSTGVLLVPRPGHEETTISIQAVDSSAVGLEYELKWIDDIVLDDTATRSWERSRILATLRRSIAAGRLAGAARLAERSARARPAGEPDSLDHAAFLEEAAFALASSDSLAESVELLIASSLGIRQACLPENDPLIAQSLTLLSSLHYNLGRYDTAAELQEQSFRISSTSSRASAEELLIANRELGITYQAAGRFRDAVHCFRTAITLDDKLAPSLARRADLENNLGETLRQLGSTREARVHALDALRLSLRYLETAVDESERTAARDLYLAILINLAGQAYDRGALVEAEDTHRQALEIVRRESASAGLHTTILRGLADTLRLQGRLVEAVPVYEEARKVAATDLPPNHLERFWIPYQFADLEFERNRFEQAAALLEEARQILLQGGEAGRVRLHFPLARLAKVRIAQARYDEAADLYEEALEVQTQFLGTWSADFAATQVGFASAIAGRDGITHTRVKDLLDQALARLQRTPEQPDARIRAHRLLAERLHARSELPAAIDALSRALTQVEALEGIAVVSSEGRASFLDAYAEAFHRLVAWAIESQDFDLAFRTMDRGRSRVLLQSLEARERASATGDTPSSKAEDQAVSRFSEARARLDAVARRGDLEPARREHRLQELESEVNAAYLSLLEAQSSAAHLRTTLHGTSLIGMSLDAFRREVLDTGEVLVAYQFSDSGGVALVVQKDKLPLACYLEAHVGDAQVLGVPEGGVSTTRLADMLLGGREPLLEQLRMPLEKPDMRPRLAALRRVLMPEVVWATLQNAKRIVIVLDGALHRFPMEALVSDDGNYWGASCPPITYAPSPSVLARTRERGPLSLTRVGCLGDPAFPGSSDQRGAPDLPASATEIRAIRAVLGRRATSWVGANATEDNLRAALKTCTVVHVASHGRVELRGRGVTQAAVRLAPGDGSPTDDGYLDLAELPSLAATADLVVLSACQTHRGETYAGEGAYTLARGLLAAGVPRVVASLWDVEDAATSAMMSAFYAHLARESLQGNTDCSLALTLARRELLQSSRWNAPAFWAPFVAIGAD